jgi:hypothetical protein
MVKETIIMLLISLFSHPFVSCAYETIEVKNGGSVEGVIEFIGATIPLDRVITSTSDEKYCGKERPAEKYVISAQRRMKNVVVFMEGIKAGKAIPEETVTVTDSNCTFVPHVNVGFIGNKFVVKNEDPVLHTIHVYTYMSGKTMYNIGLPEKGSAVTKTLTKTGLMELNCDCHPWMLGYIYIFDHPYAVVTNEKGEFIMKDIPPGTYTLEAWHEGLGKVRLTEVRVESGETSKIKMGYTWNINLY